jgi:hypothetical protein
MRDPVRGRLNSTVTIKHIPSTSWPPHFSSTDLSLRQDVSSVLQVLSFLDSSPIFWWVRSSTSSSTHIEWLHHNEVASVFVHPLVSSPELLQLSPIKFGILKFQDQHSFRSVSIRNNPRFIERFLFIQSTKYKKNTFALQNYWIPGLLPSSGIPENRKHDVSETGSVSVLRWGGKTLTQLGPLERTNL